LNNFDEKKSEQKRGVFLIFEIFENIFDIFPKMIEFLTKNNYLEYFFDRINLNFGIIDDNRLYASEILSTILIKGEFEIKESYFRKLTFFLTKFIINRDPSEEETETFENVVDSFC